MAKYAFPDVLVTTAVGRRASAGSAGPDRRVGRGRAALSAGPHPRRGQDRLAHRPARSRSSATTSTRSTSRELLRSKGIANDTTVVFYGDKNNWWACYAFWVFKLYGHEKCRIMNGGRKRWELDGRPLVARSGADLSGDRLHAKEPDLSIRAFRDEVLKHAEAGKPLVDVRSPGEYTGEMLHMPDYPQEGALRGGHIPGAVNIPWAKAANEDGTFKSAKELEKLYREGSGLSAATRSIAYCRIGERSSHTWFVLTYLLGFRKVKNYDGSWTEWGNSVGLPVERGEGSQRLRSRVPPNRRQQWSRRCLPNRPAATASSMRNTEAPAHAG